MRALVLLILAVPFLTACLALAQPTPVAVIRYPATWTPAPTPTNTPLPPPATLVIQRTPGPVASRDPKARILPTAPHNGFGLWLAIPSETPKIADAVMPKANVIVADGPATFPRNNTAFVFLNGATISPTTTLPPQYNGIVVPAGTEEELGSIRRRVAPRLLLVSVPVTETRGLDSIALKSDGVLLTNFLTERDVPLSHFPDEVSWKKDIETLAALTANPSYIVLTSTRLGKDAGDNRVSVEQWLEYALASFLLGANNTHSFFGFESALAPGVMATPVNTIQIGAPTGRMFKQNGVYQRRFTRGLVLVNPESEARAIALVRTFADLSGNRLNEVNLPPHTGMILLNVE